MGAALTDFAMQAGQGAVGGLMGLALGGINDRRQLKQQGKLQGQQIGGQMKMADYMNKKQMELWDSTNYEAQKEHMKKAGLNPGLMYGIGGGGGSTAAAAGGQVTGGVAPSGGGEAIGMGMNAAQMGLMRAQKENIEAHTANMKAGTEKTGVDTKIGTQQVEYNEGTMEHRIDQVTVTLNKTMEEVTALEQQNKITKETMAARIGQAKTEAANEILKGALMKAQENNTKQNTAESKAQVRQIEEIIKTIPEYLKVEQAELKMGQDRNPSEIDKNVKMAEYLKGQTGTLPIEIREALNKIIDIVGDRVPGKIPKMGRSKPPF